MTTAPISNMDVLFTSWRTARPDYQSFSNDGVLNEDVWAQQSPKIAFLLRESNAGFREIRGRSFKPGPGSSSRLFWRNLNIWAYTVRKFLNDEPVTFEEAYDHKEDELNQVAYINVKKRAEYRPRSNHADIQAHVDRDWDFLEKQFSLIDPDVFFCCGTFRYLAKHLSAEHLGLGVYKAHGKIVIDFYHPSGRASYKARFNRLCQMMENLPTSRSLQPFPVGLSLSR